jgi:hypothetical protein
MSNIILPPSNLILPQNDVGIKKMVDEAFLGLGDTTRLDIHDYLMSPSKEYADNPYLDLINVMRNPKNFYYTCKYLLNIELHPFQVVILQELWKRKRPMFIGSRGGSKSFLLSVYCLLRAFFNQGYKIVLVGGAFRQSKLLFDYMEGIWSNSPILRNIVGESQREGPKRDIDRCTFFIGRSQAIAIPIGTGQKIRGLRANVTVTDEFSSVPRDIYETVIEGFGAVSATPIENVKKEAGIKLLTEMGIYSSEMKPEEDAMGNQTIIAGTAYYSFNHFYLYWKKYKDIIESGGDQSRLEEIFDGEIPKDFDWTNYSVIRLPCDALPPGFMDEAQISQARVMSHAAIALMEYYCIFATDSNGFFKRSVIEKCTCNEPISLPSGSVQFEGMTKGNPNNKYVIAIDPASENDNFAIIVLELHEDHRRIVYSWTVTRQKLRERLKKSGEHTGEQSFYNYCAKKVRKLLKVFPCDHLVIDAQGGGIGIIEALRDDSLLDNDLLIWPYIRKGQDDVFWWEEKDKATDRNPGLHIIHAIQFANQKFIGEANHGLRQDLENRVLLFPKFDTASIALAIEDDKMMRREYDTLEDVVMEIEELKDELATITHTQTAQGRDKWDTPETKVGITSKKGRMRKDRYSALLIGNAVARLISSEGDYGIEYLSTGSYVGKSRNDKDVSDGPLYIGPEHIINKISSIGGCGVLRK